MRLRIDSTVVKFLAFTTVMVLIAGFLLLVFSDHRSGDSTEYDAVFSDASGLRSGDTVRIAGVRVGTVNDVHLESDNHVRIGFDVDRSIRLPSDSGAAVRYLNLVGDRYLELTEGAAPSNLAEGGTIPERRTTPALDLDVLLGGLKPLIDGLAPKQVNALSSAVLDVLQGQRGTVRALFEGSSSLFTTLGDNVGVIQDVIDHLTVVMGTVRKDKARFGDAIDRLDDLIDTLAKDRDPIGSAITALDQGTASVADLLTQARPSLSAGVDQLARLGPALDYDKGTAENALRRAPENFRKLVRTGTYGNFIQYYVCAVTVRVSDPTGKVVELPWIKQTEGRCGEPE